MLLNQLNRHTIVFHGQLNLLQTIAVNDDLLDIVVSQSGQRYTIPLKYLVAFSQFAQRADQRTRQDLYDKRTQNIRTWYWLASDQLDAKRIAVVQGGALFRLSGEENAFDRKLVAGSGGRNQSLIEIRCIVQIGRGGRLYNWQRGRKIVQIL